MVSDSTTTPEVCGDGVDNDSDGLLDCEDAACVDAPACGETACDDGVDNDGDQRIDCEDEDCWGSGCSGAVATLTAVEGAFIHGHLIKSYGLAEGSCSSVYNWSYVLQIGLANPHGTIRTKSANAAGWVTCQWSASSSWIEAETLSQTRDPLAVTRVGLNVVGDCGVGSSALPAWWTMGGERSSTVFGGPFLTRFDTLPTGAGPLWWRFDPNYRHGSINSSSSTTVAGSPCSIMRISSDYTRFWSAGVEVGSDYITSQP